MSQLMATLDGDVLARFDRKILRYANASSSNVVEVRRIVRAPDTKPISDDTYRWKC